MLTHVPFYYLRHGQTDWNKAGRIQGHTDIPLNATGLRQAADAATALAGLPITTICASPLARALRTAEFAQETLGCDLQVIDDLAEIRWGDLQGKLESSLGDGWFAKWRAGTAVVEGGETYDRFIDRATGAINACLTHPDPVLVVAHGGVYWAVQKHAALGPTHDIPNATPIHHTPPGDDHPWWTASVVGQADE